MWILKYRKEPVEIEAIQLTADNTNTIIGWIESYKGIANEHHGGLLIYTLEGTMRANVGDFIIKVVSNEFYACKTDIFAKTYEEAE